MRNYATNYASTICQKLVAERSRFVLWKMSGTRFSEVSFVEGLGHFRKGGVEKSGYLLIYAVSLVFIHIDCRRRTMTSESSQ